jgi:hypothetical protein
VAELTGLLPGAMFGDYPTGMRVIVRRERPHPGAQLDLIEERDGWRYTCFATDTSAGQLAWLDARHRSHARVEDRIRTGKDTGLGRFPSKLFAINQAWLACTLTAIDLLAWTQTILLHDDRHSRKPNRRRCATGFCTSPPAGPRRPQTPAQDRPHLALGTRPRRRLPPAARTARPRNLIPPSTSRRTHRTTRHSRPGSQPRPHHRHRQQRSILTRPEQVGVCLT